MIKNAVFVLDCRDECISTNESGPLPSAGCKRQVQPHETEHDW